MKTVFIIISICINLTHLFSQEKYDTIRADAENYFLHLKNSELEQSLDYLYPEVFKMMPRNLMLNSMKEIYQDSFLKMSFSDFHIDTVLKPIEEENILYAALLYRYKLAMHYIYETDKEVIDFTLDNLKDMHGKENVVYDKNNRTITLNINTRMLAIKAKDYNSWKFIEYKYKGAKEMLSKIFSEKILNHFDVTVEEFISR